MTDIPTESHPLQPFVFSDAKLLMLGSFPPKRERWSMEFFYPNWQNDMWRIWGYIYYGDKHYFEVVGERRFDKERIEDFCREHGIALYDAACQVRRLKDNASDKFLEIVQATDIEALIESMPHCRAVAATGQKAVEIISDLFSCEIPRVGESRDIVVCGRSLSLWRMPSSSRAYPLALEKKAESYAYMAQALEL